jgi:hypothetical protein
VPVDQDAVQVEEHCLHLDARGRHFGRIAVFETRFLAGISVLGYAVGGPESRQRSLCKRGG